MIKFFLTLLLIPQLAFAGLPPTTSKVNGDTANVTTFNFQFPNFAATRSGATTTFGLLNVAGIAPGTSGQTLTTVSGVPTWTTGAGISQAPTVQKLTSGSGTYFAPTSPAPLFVVVRMVGAGGGGGGSGASATIGGTGGTTTFGTSLLTANGGAGGWYTSGAASAGAGGSATLGTATGTAVTGGSGDIGTAAGGSVYATGGRGGPAPYYSGAGGASYGGAGQAGVTNTGGGGGGAGGGASSISPGNGGGSGGFIEAFITNPQASYSYSIGAGGTAGGAGTSGSAGGLGGSGYIEVDEYYSYAYLSAGTGGGNSGVNAGDEVITAATSCPSGTIPEDGSSLLRSGAYAALFSAIGTTYGTVDGTHFTVPNAQGVFERGAGSQTVSSIAYSGTQGTTQGDQMQGHLHTQNVESTYRTTSGSGLLVPFSGNAPSNFGSTTGPITDGTNGTPRTGAENRPANISHLHCIRYVSAATVSTPVTTQPGVTITGATTAAAGQLNFFCDATAGNTTVTLPKISTLGSTTSSHQLFCLKKIDSSGNSCIFAAASGDTIDGATTNTIAAQYTLRCIIDNAGTAWYVH